jgi:hypothetical protein
MEAVMKRSNFIKGAGAIFGISAIGQPAQAKAPAVLVRTDPDGLAPHLEQFMQELLVEISRRQVAEGRGLLLDLS